MGRRLPLALGFAATVLWLVPGSANGQGWELSVRTGNGLIHVVRAGGVRGSFFHAPPPTRRVHHVYHVHHFHYGVRPPAPEACLQLELLIRLARMGALEASSVAAMASVRPIVCTDPYASLDRWPNGERATSLTKGWYYPNGQRARSVTGTLYYPNGERARSSTGTWYYPNGERAHRRDGTWFGPTGARIGKLRNDVTGTPDALVRMIVLEHLWASRN